jgi:hypothetical protein
MFNGGLNPKIRFGNVAFHSVKASGTRRHSFPVVSISRLFDPATTPDAIEHVEGNWKMIRE